MGLAPISERRAALEARFSRWEPRTLGQILDWAVEQFGDRPYVITDERTCSYREMQRWSVGIARGLTAAGVRSGDHVALVMANYPEFVAVKYAIARAGAVAVPINFLNRRDELGYVLEQSDAVALITMDRFRDLDYLAALDDLAPGWEYHGGGERFPRLHTIAVFATSPDGGRTDATSLEALTSAGDQVTELTMPADPSSPADILYTSGTTGSPKGVLLTHDMLLRTAYAAAHHRAFQDGRRIIFSLPMYHVYGYGEGMLPALFCGGAIIPQLVFDPVATLRGVERHRADDALLIPTMTMGMLDALRAGTYDLSSLTAVISSGAPSPPGIWPEIFELLSPEELTTGYGMTETTASATCTRPDDPIERLRETNGRLRDAGVAGDPQLGGRLVVYRVVDPATGREVGPGALGELRARGPGVTPGYYDKPEETAAAFDDEGWLRTGDLGRIDADDYITLVGRDKDVYRCGGEQVVPKEVEDLLTTHPAVAQAHVVPLADERMGEVGVAWVIFRDGAFAEREELIAFCAKRLARFKVPQHVLPITAEQLPTTASGRARKFLLVERAARELGGQ